MNLKRSSKLHSNGVNMTTYILRVNLDINATEKYGSSVRFKSAFESIKKLSSGQNTLVIISHRGRPEGFDKNLSLKRMHKLLQKKLGKSIKFFGHFGFRKIKAEIGKSAPGSVFMLENIRFLPGEIRNDSGLAKQLASLGDVFVNDDFATAHRENASNVGIAKYIKHQIGPNLKRELDLLIKAINRPKHPFVLIVGDTKISDKMGVIKHLERKCDFILLGGGPANTVIKAAGWDIDDSIYESNMMAAAKKMTTNDKIVIPEDLEGENGSIFDIGPETIKKFSGIIRNAKTIIWGGPMGFFEKKGFEKGSYAIARAIASSNAFSIVGGGETTEIITALKLEKKISLLSTGGGAMLDFLAGKKLPALQALKK